MLISQIRHRVASYTRRIPLVHRYLSAVANYLGLLKKTPNSNTTVLVQSTFQSSGQSSFGRSPPLTHREQMIFNQLVQAAERLNKTRS